MPETMTDMYVWTEEDPEGGEGVLVVYSPEIGKVISLHSRKREIAEAMRQIALMHMWKSGHRVRLVRFARAEDIDTFTPSGPLQV